ncbi:MAG TPA: M48 family metallopeptidase [Longimicrobiaceae bacterium]|nr:M48 family metallopeptidase [Longimicrobiaceae bacterium]
MTEARENEIGRVMATDINAHLPLVSDPILDAYVTSLGRLLASVSSRPGLDYHFYIIDSSVVNAFALPGGYVYVTRGLIEQTRNGAELAAVLAHEIGHVAARHGVEKLERQLRTGSVVDLLYTLFLGGEPQLLRDNALEMAGALWSARHSREDEAQADRLAVRYLIKAGFDPDAMVTILQTLLQEERSDGVPRANSWFSSHPLTSERIDVAKREIQGDLKAAPPVARVHLASYPLFLQRIEELPPPPDATGP